MYLVKSLIGTSQTLDSVALTAFASQYRGSIGSELQTAIDQHKAQATIVDSTAEILAAASTLTRKDTGKTFFLDLAGGFATTLPSPEPGLKFTFVVKTAPTTAYTIVSASSANIIKGSVVTPNVGVADLETAGGDTVSFVAAVATAGDRVEMTSDGTGWHMVGVCSVNTGITITTAS